MGMSRTFPTYLAHFAGFAIRDEDLARDPGGTGEIVGQLGDRVLVAADDAVDALGRQLAGQFLHGGEAPGAMRVAGRLEHDRQGRAARAAHLVANRGNVVGEELGGGVERVVGQPRNQQDAVGHQRRSRCSVMPIFSSASLSASLTIFTVTASTRSSCRNSVSQTWSATASISLKCVSPSASEQANFRSM